MMPDQPGRTVTVYVGAHPGNLAEGIHILHLNTSTGELSPVANVPDIQSPFFLAASPDNRFLFAGCVQDEFDGRPGGSVKSFRIEPQTGNLQLLSEQHAGGKVPCYVSVDRTGRCLLVGNYGSGSVAAFLIDQNGKLEPASRVVQHEGSSVNTQRQEGPHVHSIVLSPDSRYAFAADLGTDKIETYRLDATEAQIEPNNPPSVSTQPGAGPRHIAFHPDGSKAYLINELDNTFVVYDYNPESGALTERQTISALPDGYDGESYCADIVVHPSGRFLYGSNRGHDSIAIMSIDPSTGELAPVGHQAAGGAWPWNLEIDPTETFLLSANQRGNNVTSFRINEKTGALQQVGVPVQVRGAVCVKSLLVSAARGTHA